MFALKKKKMRGVQGGPGFPAAVADPASEVLGEEPLEWLEQHHKKTMNKSQAQLNNLSHTPPPQNNHLLPPVQNHHINNNSNNAYNAHKNIINKITHATPAFEYPQSGDESDNPYSQMENLRSQFYTPDPQKRTKEYHLEQSMQAVELLKAASGPDGWKKVDKHKSGCIVYQSTSPATIPSHGDSKFPAFKGEHVIRGFKAQEVFSIIAVRKLWDDWYDEFSNIETYDDATSLMYMVMKGTISSKPRDLSMVERIHIDADGTIYSAACSVDSVKIPRVSGKVRAEVFLAGWVIQPLPSNPPITKITYVIHTDLLNRLPRFIAKRSLAKRAMVIATIETYLKKNGSPTLGGGNTHTNSRPRSLSEPIKPERLMLPPESDDEDEPSGSAFLAPLAPIKSRYDLSHFNDSAAESAEEEPPVPRRERQLPQKPRSSGKERAPTSSLFSQEFLDSNSFMDESALFGDSSLLFGQGSIFEGSQKKDEVPAPNAKARSQVSLAKPQQTTTTPEQRKPEKIPERSPERKRAPSNVSRTAISEPEVRKPLSTKRVSIPVVAPKSEARAMKSSGSNQLTVPESSELITLNTPPLTPPASIIDGTSDSDITLPEVKIVPRTPKSTPGDVDTTSRPSSLAMASLTMKSSPPPAMQSPSAMMQARRHSTLLSRGTTGFVPRHSNAVPIRGNPNVSLQSLTRPSGPNGTMTTAMKRHSTAPSLDSNRSSTTFTPMMVLPHRHSETARKALAMFKVLASSPEDRWRAISSENGFKSYSRVISGAGLPMLRGEGTITGGWTVEQINAAIESSGCRQVWDERFENMSIAETFNHNEYLFHITLRGIGSLTGRDLAGVTIIDRDPLTSALYNVSTSVLDPTIPEDPGRIRAMLELSGWSLRPTFDGQGNTVSVNVTFVIQIDIRGSLPSSVVKSMTSSMTTAVPRLNQFINKSGYPPFASHISGTRLLDTFDPKTGFYELCYKAAPGWSEVRIGRKVYKEGYDFFIKPDDPSVRVEMAPDFGGVRVWTTLDHEGQSIIAQVSRKGQNTIEPEPTEEQKQQEAEEAAAIADSHFQDGSKQSDIDLDMQQSSPSSRKRRSASYATPQANAFGASSTRPDSQASVTSKASQGSDRSRSRSRTPRSIVTLPAGTPPPPLPRRSSSLTRYSIPISPYLAPIDAPPLPTNTSAAIANAAETTSPRSVSSSISPLGSPTLGIFHVPHAPSTAATGEEPSSPTESKRISAVISPPISPMESISNVLFENANSTAAVKEEPSAPEGNTTIVAAAAAASKTETVSVVSASGKSLDVPSLSSKEMAEDIIGSSLLSLQASPTSTPMPSPSPMVVAFARGPSMTSPAPASTTTFQPTSSLKSSASSASLGGVRRVTFSLDTIDKSSSVDDSPLDNLMKVNSSGNAPNLAKEHSVQVVSALAALQEYQAVVESGSEYESDEAEFVEANDELAALSDDELELALVLASAGSWPSSSSVVEQKEKEEQRKMVGATMRTFEYGVRLVVEETPVEVKAAIVLMLLVYYAGRLASLLT
ncbi:hypothetical protein BGZ58_004125 [Dissophora ornata]|nr:hypothetical protein BGZ58_004125 [Dissophora ornata]